jgi:Ca-activated chloride channel family protein
MNVADPKLLWLALAAPAAAALAWWTWRRRLAATSAWVGRGLWNRLWPELRTSRLLTGGLLLAIALVGSVLALARPRWGQTEEKVERKGVDVVFVLDTSLSMAAPDVQPSRFTVAQNLVRRIAQAMPGNRVALIETEGQDVVMAPLTTDAAVLDLLLDAAQPGSLPTPGTVLAPALAQAAKLFPEGAGRHRAIVLISDGEDFGGGLSEQAGKLAESGIVVHAIGVGTPQGSPIPVPGGAANELKKDADGKVVVTRLQEDALAAIARTTGGLYQRATAAGYDPQPIERRLAAMEGRTLEEDTLHLLEERFQWPLALALGAVLLLLLVRPFSDAADETAGEAAS